MGRVFSVLIPAVTLQSFVTIGIKKSRLKLNVKFQNQKLMKKGEFAIAIFRHCHSPPPPSTNTIHQVPPLLLPISCLLLPLSDFPPFLLSYPSRSPLSSYRPLLSLTSPHVFLSHSFPLLLLSSPSPSPLVVLSSSPRLLLLNSPPSVLLSSSSFIDLSS